MKPAHVLAALAALVLTGNAPPRAPDPSAEELASLRTDTSNYRSYPQPEIVAWEEEFRRALGDGSLDRAAAAVAPRFGLTTAEMRELGRLWVLGRAHSLDGRGNAAGIAAMREQWLALLARNRRAPLMLQAVAEGLDALGECRAEDFAAMMAGSADPAADAWTIANRATCADNFLRAAAAAPGRTIPALIRFAHYGTLRAGDALPLYEVLTGPAALDRIAAADRPALAAWLYARRAELLFRTGLTERAAALIESLPEEMRNRMLVRSAGRFTAMVDGLPVTIVEERADESLKLNLAAAYALAGRTAQAEALFASLAGTTAAHRAFACAGPPEPGPQRPQGPQGSSCAQIPHEQRLENLIDLLLLDHLLHHPADDPYPLAEAGIAGSFTSASSTIAELRCRVFAEPQYADICGNARALPLYWIAQDPGDGDPAADARQRAALDALPLPGFAEARAATAADFARVLAAGGAPAEPVRAARQSVTPAPAPYAELPLPAARRGPRPAAAPPPRDVGTLPEGFEPVRIERSGERAVAISLSQTLDPTGEVSQGGYWVHLSTDGGRHWERPLYTGLADRFPYVVPRTSRLPLLSGDGLDLEVEIAELDTASITYPPVALRSRRQASNLYLRIPLAELARDGDGDGLTDIAERALLLDRARTDGGTPFIVGSDSGANCRAATPDRIALIGLLQQLFSVRTNAIVEPVDRAPDAPLSAGWRGAGAAADRPVFIQGDPRDYLCLRPDRLMIVYGESDLAALGRFRPDFHAVTVPRIVYNRARDRGYVIWSAGWTGGTYRLRLVNGRWVFESISSWIT
ncbi:MAG TPA: hypothetical protein VGO55_11820 [Allosphingosinicella sp.]|jgi:hypothetical protein|nr:hypothetical protein [Allosphingosinicella sp.]